LTDDGREQKARSIVDCDALGLAHQALIEEWKIAEPERYVILAALANRRDS